MRNLRVILSTDVPNLGEEGDIREVAPGYARNYLLPKGLAVSYSKQSLSILKERRGSIEKRKEEKRNDASGMKERIESMSIVLEMPSGNTGKLFGSVNSATLADQLAAEGIQIERKRIEIPEHSIKLLGKSTVRIRLYGDQTANLAVAVIPVGGKLEDLEKPEPPKAKEQAEEPEPPKAKEQAEEPELPKAKEQAEEPEPPKAKKQAEEPEPPKAKKPTAEKPEPPKAKKPPKAEEPEQSEEPAEEQAQEDPAEE